MDNNLSFAASLAQASLEVGGVLGTDKTNLEQRYDYISADKILSICGQALAKQGIVIIPEITDHGVDAVERQGKNPRLDAWVNFKMHITNGQETMVAEWWGRGSDYNTPDKALYKAITSGHKYFIAKLLNIGAGNEDGEHDEPPEPPRGESKSSKKEPAPAEPVPAPDITLEQAMNVTNKEGVKYGNLQNDALAHIANGIRDAVKAGKYPEKAEEYALKLKAAELILAARQG